MDVWCPGEDAHAKTTEAPRPLRCRFCGHVIRVVEKRGALVFRRDAFQQAEELRAHVRGFHNAQWHAVQKYLHRSDVWISAPRLRWSKY